jgi:hypothetical protein
MKLPSPVMLKELMPEIFEGAPDALFVQLIDCT